MKFGGKFRGLLASIALVASHYPCMAAGYPSAHFDLIGAVFDDGGGATGGFDFNVDSPSMPLPAFYNVQITTSAGLTLPGSMYTSTGVCYNNRKKLTCAPGANFVMYVETGVAGQPGYDHFQFATFFAPNASIGQNGVLDPTLSYEIGCTQNMCFTRHIAAGAIRWGFLIQNANAAQSTQSMSQ